MRVSVLMLLLLGCSEDDQGEKGSESSHYCCTLTEFCLVCGCTADETSIARSMDEAACRQLIDSEDYRCALGNETTALAECVDQPAGSSEPGASSLCVEWGNGCACGSERSNDDVPFAGTCNETAFGERGVCCQREEYCYCEPVLCGISAVNGLCVCGIGVYFDSLVASCDGTAGTCCTQDTGYCYCEDGCDARFANRIVASCNSMTAPATCSDYEVEVPSCE